MTNSYEAIMKHIALLEQRVRESKTKAERKFNEREIAHYQLKAAEYRPVGKSK